MRNELTGNSYKYIIDESYGINKDGFIAIGTESIVYKGLKTKLDGGLQFSCVLKFKPKSIIVGGAVVDRLKGFKTEEWKIFEELRECRSIVRVDDVIDDLGDFSLSCDKLDGGIINAEAFFCVVEEFIDGWNLDEFCREEYWKLRRIDSIANGLSNIVDYNDFTDAEKKLVATSYNYDNQLKYQNQILLFMINLCEIMEFVTEQKNILHLDIKPENIMVTRYGKELVLIDFGRSRQVTKADRFVLSNLSAVDYNQNETLDRMFQYGTLGYAAPECYSEASGSSKFPFTSVCEQGKMSLESDIFSFGATFWECLNIFELVTKNKQFSDDVHDFYRDNFLSDFAYCNRDLSLTSNSYHKKLEQIIKKCTRARERNFIDSDKYYHSYKELRRDLENAKDSVPTIVKEENVKVKTAFSICGIMLSLFVVFWFINFAYHLQAFAIAENKWNTLITSYNETQFYKLEEIAKDLISSAPANQVDSTYDKIVSFTYINGGDISEYEATMLVELLEQMGNREKLSQRVDEIMKQANTSNFKAISAEVVKLNLSGESIGYELATAIYNVEVGKTGILDAYKTLQAYCDDQEFRGAVIKLKNVLNNDQNIRVIQEGTNQNRGEILEFFHNII